MGWCCDGWGGMGGFGWMGLLLGGLLLLLLIGGIVALVVLLARSGQRGGSSSAQGDAGLTPGGRDRALQILQERYARGEITREEYEQMRDELRR